MNAPYHTPYLQGYFGDRLNPLVAITAKCHPWLIDKLSEKYYVAYQPAITYTELYQLAPTLSGIIVTTRLRIDVAMLDNAPKLEWIGRLGSGLELIDVTYAESKGIKVVSSPEGNANAVGEHTLGMLLSILNKLTWSHFQVKEFNWLRDENRGRELKNSTIGIIGYGNTGTAFARLLQPFGVTVMAYDINKYGFAFDHVKEASLAQIQRYAQVISFHVPLNAQSEYMGNSTFFNQLERQPIILNTSRGKVIRLTDLRAALEAGKISGAGLDVLENEKLQSYNPEEKEMLSWLTNQPNVIITPHIAGYSHEAFLRMAEVVHQKLFS